MLFSLFFLTFPNKLLYFVCIPYLVIWLRPWATLLLNTIKFDSLGLLVELGRVRTMQTTIIGVIYLFCFVLFCFLLLLLQGQCTGNE